MVVAVAVATVAAKSEAMSKVVATAVELLSAVYIKMTAMAAAVDTAAVAMVVEEVVAAMVVEAAMARDGEL